MFLPTVKSTKNVDSLGYTVQERLPTSYDESPTGYFPGHLGKYEREKKERRVSLPGTLPSRYTTLLGTRDSGVESLSTRLLGGFTTTRPFVNHWVNSTPPSEIDHCKQLKTLRMRMIPTKIRWLHYSDLCQTLPTCISQEY